MKRNIHTGAQNIFQKFMEVLRGNKSPEVLATERYKRAQARRERYRARNSSFAYGVNSSNGGVNHPSILRPRKINPLHWSGKAWKGLSA